MENILSNILEDHEVKEENSDQDYGVDNEEEVDDFMGNILKNILGSHDN